MGFKGSYCLVFAIILSALSLLTHQFIDRYKISDENLLVKGSFDAGLSGWNLEQSDRDFVSLSGGAINIHSNDAAQGLRIWQDIDMSQVGQFVYLRAWVKAEQIIAGDKPWNNGRIIFLQMRGEKPDYSTPHVLIGLDGNSAWGYYEGIFPIHKESSRALVMIQLSGSSGVLSCKNIFLAKAQTNPYFEIVRGFLLVCWIFLLVTLFYPLAFMNRGGLTGRLIIIVLFGTILGGTLLPGSIKNSILHQIDYEEMSIAETLKHEPASEASAESMVPLTVHEWTYIVTKLAHFFLFAALTFTLLWYKTQDPWYVILAVVILAAGTELAQLLVDGRGALPTDVVLDLTGGFAGAAIWNFFGKRTDTNQART